MVSSSRLNILIAGLPGSGKTTLARLLKSKADFTIFTENHDEKLYHEDFAANVGRWAFHNQIEFLVSTAVTQLMAQQCNRSCLDGSIYDSFYIYTMYLYQQGYLEPRDFLILERLFQLLDTVIVPPSITVLLEVTPHIALRRIQLRERASDRIIGLDLDFLIRLQVLLSNWLNSWKHSELLVLDTEGLDIVHNEEAQDQLVDIIMLNVARGEKAA